MNQDQFELVVNRRWLETPEIMVLELSRADGSALPSFSAGSHLEVGTPSGHRRQYSLCNDPSIREPYRIAVLHEPQSRGGSRSLHDSIQEGSTLRVSAPRNLFPLAENAQHSILFAGGIGITPILSMAHSLHSQGASFELHYFGRAKDKMAFIKELKSLPFSTQVQLHIGDGAALDMQALLSGHPEQTQLYVCGPNGFMDYVFDEARKADIPSQCLHSERFSADTSTLASCEFEVEISSTGEVIKIPAGCSTASVLAEHGHFIPVSCEQGVCGSCVTGVLSGTPDHRDSILDEDQKVANDCFTPCCSRSLSARLVLAL